METCQDNTLSPATFRRFCDLVYSKSGIVLGPRKEALVSARMGKRMRVLGLSSYDAYYDLVRHDKSGDELVEMLNAISTNVTYFFRENRHFELLKDALRGWRSSSDRDEFSIWSAAASTGEEPYSIAITAATALPDACRCRILATDISTRVLQVARDGCYEVRQLEKVPEEFRRRFFNRADDGESKGLVVNDTLKRMITFARLNLAHPPYPMRGPFDVVFCRNVMIYFDNAVRKALLSEIWRLLKPGGLLMVGHAESLSGMLSDFRSVEPSVYIK